MEKIFAYCLNCKEEVEIVVEYIVLRDTEKRIAGRCPKCKDYLCRIKIEEESQAAS